MPPSTNSKVPAVSQRPQFHTLDDTYDDACDFGKFALNPAAYLLTAITNSCSSSHSKQVGTYLSKHLQQIVYVVSVFGCWAVVFTQVYPLTDNIPMIPSYHKTIGRIVFLLCVTSWRYAATTCPGNITKSNMTKYDNYAYDGWLYHKDNVCPTLDIVKLARSKYDRHTGRHIPRFDHYCGWINQTIGEENYRFFILFLIVHVVMCAYGTIMLYRLLWHMAILIINNNTSGGIVFHHVLFQQEFCISMTFFLMFIMTILLGGFLAFHLFLISVNTTTNEYKKWKDIKTWHSEETRKYKASISAASFGDEEDCNRADTPTNPGPMPINAYDLGRYSANIHEVMFPRSLNRARKLNHPHVE